MKNKVALASFFMVLMLAAGCNHEPGPTTGSSTGFVGGSEALELSFIEGSPPTEVTDKLEGEEGFPFDVTLVMENVGEYDILPTQTMFITMSGFFPGDFSINNPDRELLIEYPGSGDGIFEGVKQDSDGNPIQGKIAYIRFPESSDLEFLYREPIPASTPLPFRVEVCYPYETEVVSDLCLMDDLTSRDQPICSPSGARKVSNSGGPVHISSVTQSVAGKHKILLRFEVEKVGKSDLFYYESRRCENNFRNRDRLLVEIDTGLEGLSCAGLIGGAGLGSSNPSLYNGWSGDVILKADGTAAFTCIQTLQSKDQRDGLKNFKTAIAYLARDAISTAVTVKHSLS